MRATLTVLCVLATLSLAGGARIFAKVRVLHS
jgi:hypothetical protein